MPAGEGVSLAEIFHELEARNEVGVPAHDVDGRFELRPARAGDGRTHLVYEDLAQRLEVRTERLLELAQAPHPQGVVA